LFAIYSKRFAKPCTATLKGYKTVKNHKHVLLLMEVLLKDGKFLAEDYRTLRRRKFGKAVGDKIELHPVEAAYLLLKDMIEVRKDGRQIDFFELMGEACRDRNFIPLFLVYSDLRDRGKRVIVEDKFLYGDRLYFPVSERQKMSVSELYSILADKGEYILSVVDEESEITYYRVFEPSMRGKAEVSDRRISGFFAGDRVLSREVEIFKKFFYGSERDGLVALSVLEALYLQEKGYLEVNKELRDIARTIERNFEDRYGLYRDLKERGLVVKTGFKFGSDFRVYDEITDVSQLPHSKYLVSMVDRTTLPEISRAVRLANSVRKKMVFAFRKQKEWKYLALDRVKV
jgi:tRNA-intron endonuclease